MYRLDTISREYGLKINVQKTKVMIIDRIRNNQPEIRNVAGFEAVSRFNYLGSVITNNGGCEEEIRRRLTMARSATVNKSVVDRLSNIQTVKHINHIELNILKTLFEIIQLEVNVTTAWIKGKRPQTRIVRIGRIVRNGF
ncbi:uncharacterized protein LOC126883410 [Diabrotica virgifera virgifera]|uniref:Uncharacterized protein n=1 Tax=Diabrotica virgifera virgifera TaxID=50390 RepID=A0ABM5K3Z4_DIAVI|nr:uncharacterized protein LOC126883410 [Diabrotica virgifera virgifera]